MNEIDDSSLKKQNIQTYVKNINYKNHQRICMHVNSIETNRIHCNAYNNQHFLTTAYYTMIALLRYVLIGMMWVLAWFFCSLPAFGLYLCAFFVYALIYSIHYYDRMKVLACVHTHSLTKLSKRPMCVAYTRTTSFRQAYTDQSIMKNNVIAAVTVAVSLITKCVNSPASARHGRVCSLKIRNAACYTIIIIWVICGKSYTIKANDDR